MTGPATSPHTAEEHRIRAAYARRAKRPAAPWLAPDQVLLYQQRERRVLRALGRRGVIELGPLRILDAGCGTGIWLRDLIRWGAKPEHLWGVDLLSDRIEQAARLCPGEVHLMCANAASLPHEVGRFDIVIQSTVFTSILDQSLRTALAERLVAALAPGGFILWYDYFVSNPANPDAAGVNAREIRRLFPTCDIRLERLTLAPPIARLLAGWSVTACRVLEQARFLCTHYLGIIALR